MPAQVHRNVITRLCLILLLALISPARAQLVVPAAGQQQGGPWLLKYARINATASGETTVVTGVAGKRIIVLGYLFSSLLGVSVAVKSNPGGTTLAGAFDLPANGDKSYSGGLNAPAFQTEVGQALVFDLGLATSVRGHLTYIEF